MQWFYKGLPELAAFTCQMAFPTTNFIDIYTSL